MGVMRLFILLGMSLDIGITSTGVKVGVNPIPFTSLSMNQTRMHAKYLTKCPVPRLRN